MFIRNTFLWAFLVAIIVLGSGCGGKIKATGKIVRGGHPMSISDKGVFVISFMPDPGDPAKPQTFAAEAKPDGSFVINGPDRQGIPPGKYKVAVQAFDPYPKNDLLKGKFGPGKTTLSVEVGKSEVVVDVGP